MLDARGLQAIDESWRRRKVERAERLHLERLWQCNVVLNAVVGDGEDRRVLDDAKILQREGVMRLAAGSKLVVIEIG